MYGTSGGGSAMRWPIVQSLALELQVVINILQLAITSGIIQIRNILPMIEFGTAVISADGLPVADIAKECECICQHCLDARHCRRLDCYVEEYHPCGGS
jgi:hypothetical protein